MFSSENLIQLINVYEDCSGKTEKTHITNARNGKGIIDVQMMMRAHHE